MRGSALARSLNQYSPLIFLPSQMHSLEGRQRRLLRWIREPQVTLRFHRSLPLPLCRRRPSTLSIPAR